MQRKFSFAHGEYYHIYNRGVDKRVIFTNDYERNRFLLLMYLCNSSIPLVMKDLLNTQGRSLVELLSFERGETLVDIGAYCLMPNHFHILIKEKTKGGVTSFMKKIGTAYSSFFNQTHGRTGSLFQGRFKAEHIDSDNYLKYIFSYIHINPIKLIDPMWKEIGISDKKKAREYLNLYSFSSFYDYIPGDKSRIQSVILNKSAFPSYFESRANFESHISDFTNYPRTVLV